MLDGDYQHMTIIKHFKNITFGSRPGYPKKNNVSTEEVLYFLKEQNGENITKIISLLDTESARKYYEQNLYQIYQQEAEKGVLQYKSFPMPRFSFPQENNEPNFRGFTDFLNSLYKSKWTEEPIYMHCSGGKGRCGVMISGLLLREGLSLSDAIKETKTIANLRDDGQEQFIKNWYHYEQNNK